MGVVVAKPEDIRLCVGLLLVITLGGLPYAIMCAYCAVAIAAQCAMDVGYFVFTGKVRKS